MKITNLLGRIGRMFGARHHGDPTSCSCRKCVAWRAAVRNHIDQIMAKARAAI